ncbi:MAG: hypothetical protein WC758_00120 [Candidatus Woesearchaeota archaeon]
MDELNSKLMATITNKDLSFSVAPNGQLVSIINEGIEYMHGAGKPTHLQTKEDILGWNNSEITLFPIIGPPKTDYGVVVMNGDDYSLDRHGISRCIDFEIKDIFKDSILLSQKYWGQPVLNPNFSRDKKMSKNAELLNWLPYTLDKKITNNGEFINVELSLKNDSMSKSMNFRMGWHPAFKLQGAIEDSFFYVSQDNYKIISMQEIIEQSVKGALVVPSATNVLYINKKLNNGIFMQTKEFNDLMFWTKSKDSGMVCIEPVTHVPTKDGIYLDGVASETLEPGKSKTYSVEIHPFKGSSF